jgi:aconitate hydratase
MSPPLVVAYAIAGNMNVDLTKDSLGKDKNGNDVYLKDIWPTNEEVQDILNKSLTSKMFQERYADVFEGDENWRSIETSEGENYEWGEKSTYIRNPSFFDNIKDGSLSEFGVKEARVLALMGDSVTTDHISPAGRIEEDGPAGLYLKGNGVKVHDFNSYGSRRGNHEVMMRGTFANIRIRNEMVKGKEGGYTLHVPSGETMSIYDAAMKYKEEGTPLVVIGGKEYGTGSSRDWAAKGTLLLGVKAVITESFERIHRSNLIGMGVLPLEFIGDVNRETLGLDGSEVVSLKQVGDLAPCMKFEAQFKKSNGQVEKAELLSRIDTADEMEYFKNGGILQFVLRNIKSKN